MYQSMVQMIGDSRFPECSLTLKKASEKHQKLFGNCYNPAAARKGRSPARVALPSCYPYKVSEVL